MQVNSANRIVSMTLPLLLAFVNAPAVGAQSRDMSMKHSAAMPRSNGMAGMMSGPHHVLAMAYGENLASFARAVNVDVKRSNMVNVELAQPATAEMRRSFDQMKTHHQAQMAAAGSMMSDSNAMSRSARRDSMMKTSMPNHSAQMMKMDDMQAHMTSIETHLGMLESEVGATSPNATKVVAHTAEILKACASAMRMPMNSSGKMGRRGAR